MVERGRKRFLLLFLITSCFPGCTDPTTPAVVVEKPKAQEATLDPEQALSGMLELHCEMQAYDSERSEGAWKKEYPDKAKRWSELGEKVGEHLLNLPPGQKEKYQEATLRGAFECYRSAPPIAEEEAKPEVVLDQTTGWTVVRLATPMDGDIYGAKKSFHFPEQQTTIETAVACYISSQQVAVNLVSVVGPTGNPGPQSAFATELYRPVIGSLYRPPGERNPNLIPIGRMKMNGGDVRSLKGSFAMDKTSTNVARFSGLNVFETNALLKRIGVPAAPDGNYLMAGEINWSALVAQIFPMDIELNNGAGTFNIHLDKSPEVGAVLRECGSDNPAFVLNQPDQPSLD